MRCRGKISGPIMDRIDIQKSVHPVDFFGINEKQPMMSSEQIRKRVERARKIQQERYADEEGINCNAQMFTSLIQKYCNLDKQSLQLLKEVSEEYGYSARVIHKLLRLARTSADLDASENIRLEDVQAAKCKAVTLAQQYTENGHTIISGMAKGIDSYAHTACLKVGGYTVAVVGNGLDICYPSEHKKLMECIIEKGLVLSEYPPGIKPTRYTFPRRNRLISAWSEHIVVIAPGKGSGALITTEYGRKYGRKVENII